MSTALAIERLLGTPRAGMRVRHSGRTYTVEADGFAFASADTPITPLTASEQVVDADGSVIPPTGIFFRTAATIDPYHIIFDIF